jgi:hypothetical protein
MPHKIQADSSAAVDTATETKGETTSSALRGERAPATASCRRMLWTALERADQSWADGCFVLAGRVSGEPY